MEQIIKKVLRKIENNGYEAYIVGGYIRDFLLNKKSFDIDICTNALPKDLKIIFPNAQNNGYGGINFKLKKYNFDITTYRKEKKYEKRKPIEIEYVNNLFVDIERRDFRINALCMNSKGLIIDLVSGINDINNKLISIIGNCDEKFKEDPLRMLRAIRFMTTLDFILEDSIIESIKKNKELILTLSNNRIKEELDKILINPNYNKGLTMLKELGILELLQIKTNKIVYVNDLNGMWSQLDFEFNSSFTKEEKKTIKDIREIINNKTVDKVVLFNYGLYTSLVAGEILGINKILINKIYKRMPLYSKKDLTITPQEIMELLNIKPGVIVNQILTEITRVILEGKLKNNHKEIKKFLLLKKATWQNEFKEDFGK